MGEYQWIKLLRKRLTNTPKPQEERKDSVQEKNAISKYYITAGDRANYVRKLRAMIDTRNQEFWHPDLTKPRILTDERDVKLLYSMMAET